LTPGLVPPRIIPSSRALPQYPAAARRAGLLGTVILMIVVDADGSVGQIEVLRSPDQRWGFDLSAIDAVKQWRYEPALMNGKAVAAYITVMVEFTLSR
jgi:protein TonB